MPSLMNGLALARRPSPAVANLVERPVRPAMPHDRAQIRKLLEFQHAEAPIATVNWKKVDDLLALMMPSGPPKIDPATGKPEQRLYFSGVAVEDGKVVGCVGLVVCHLWWTDDWHVDERFFFVHPDHRKSRHAERLISWCKGVQTQLAIPLVSCVFSTEDTERKVAFFKRHLPLIGAIFRYTGD